MGALPSGVALEDVPLRGEKPAQSPAEAPLCVGSSDQERTRWQHCEEAENSPPDVCAIAGEQVCRFCLEDVDLALLDDTSSSARIVAPCACKGTSAMVHLSCLKKWQDTRLAQQLSPDEWEQGSLCPVCRERLMVDGAPLLSSISSIILCVGPGSLLVATEQLEGEGRTFHRSVILICSMQTGSRVRGVDLTRRASLSPTWGQAAEQARTDTGLFLGGPVCGGRLGVVQYVALSTFPAQGREAAVVRRQDNLPGLFGPEPWSALNESQALQVIRREEEQDVVPSEQSEKLLLYQGHCVWVRGQLEGEICRGLWAVCNASAADIFEVPPEALWHQLVASSRLSRANSC